jgi:hypothetical protein
MRTEYKQLHTSWYWACTCSVNIWPDWGMGLTASVFLGDCWLLIGKSLQLFMGYNDWLKNLHNTPLPSYKTMHITSTAITRSNCLFKNVLTYSYKKADYLTITFSSIIPWHTDTISGVSHYQVSVHCLSILIEYLMLNIAYTHEKYSKKYCIYCSSSSRPQCQC